MFADPQFQAVLETCTPEPRSIRNLNCMKRSPDAPGLLVAKPGEGCPEGFTEFSGPISILAGSVQKLDSPDTLWCVSALMCPAGTPLSRGIVTAYSTRLILCGEVGCTGCPQLEFSADGILIGTMTMPDVGGYQEVCYWNPDTHMRSAEYRFQRLQKHGLAFSFDADGLLSSVVCFDHGVETGVALQWDIHGEVESVRDLQRVPVEANASQVNQGSEPSRQSVQVDSEELFLTEAVLAYQQVDFVALGRGNTMLESERALYTRYPRSFPTALVAYSRAKVDWRRGRFQEAFSRLSDVMPILQEAIKRMPSSDSLIQLVAGAFYILGDSSCELGDHAAAKDNFSRARTWYADLPIQTSFILASQLHLGFQNGMVKVLGAGGDSFDLGAYLRDSERDQACRPAWKIMIDVDRVLNPSADQACHAVKSCKGKESLKSLLRSALSELVRHWEANPGDGSYDRSLYNFELELRAFQLLCWESDMISSREKREWRENLLRAYEHYLGPKLETGERDAQKRMQKYLSSLCKDAK